MFTNDEEIQIRAILAATSLAKATKDLNDQHKAEIQAITDQANTDKNALVDVYAKRLDDAKAIYQPIIDAAKPPSP